MPCNNETNLLRTNELKDENRLTIFIVQRSRDLWSKRKIVEKMHYQSVRIKTSRAMQIKNTSEFYLEIVFR